MNRLYPDKCVLVYFAENSRRMLCIYLRVEWYLSNTFIQAVQKGFKNHNMLLAE